MSALLLEAVRGLKLQPGQTYRAELDGHTVEVKLVDEAPRPGLADQVMLQPWAEFPFNAVGTVHATLGSLPPPDPPVIPPEEEFL